MTSVVAEHLANQSQDEKGFPVSGQTFNSALKLQIMLA